MALEFLAGMNAAARLDFPLDEFRGIRDPRGVDRAADERFACLPGEDWSIPGITERDARLRTSSLRIEAHGASNAHHGEVAAAARHFHKAGTGARRRGRQFH